MTEFRLYGDQFPFPPLSCALSNLSSRTGLHGTQILSNGSPWSGVCLSGHSANEKKKIEATVGVYPFMAQIFDLSPLRLSLQLEQLPPKEVIPHLSPRLD